MAYCLRQAIGHEMRHVFVVLPFTAIIDQNVRVLREALTLPGENAESVVVAVHHKADYESYAARAFASQWDSPVIVTTSVQGDPGVEPSRCSEATARVAKFDDLHR
jgi:CRISPR-associated endonuclease/helicase Cas3